MTVTALSQVFCPYTVYRQTNRLIQKPYPAPYTSSWHRVLSSQGLCHLPLGTPGVPSAPSVLSLKTQLNELGFTEHARVLWPPAFAFAVPSAQNTLPQSPCSVTPLCYLPLSLGLALPGDFLSHPPESLPSGFQRPVHCEVQRVCLPYPSRQDASWRLVPPAVASLGPGTQWVHGS